MDLLKVGILSSIFGSMFFSAWLLNEYVERSFYVNTVLEQEALLKVSDNRLEEQNVFFIEPFQPREYIKINKNYF